MLFKTSNLFKFLFQPYPFYESRRAVLLRLLIIGFSVAFVLMVFQPFGTSQINFPSKNFFLAGYGVIAFLTFGFTMLGLPSLLPAHFKEEKWVVWKHISFFLFGLFLTYICNYLYLKWYFGTPMSWSGFLGFGPIVLAVGFVPTALLTTFDWNRRNKKYRAGAQKANARLKVRTRPESILQLKDEKGKDSLQIGLSQLLFIQAANNYVEIHFLQDNSIRKTLIRNKLSNIEKQISSDSIKRCHRSYLVNITKVKQVSGNAQGYKLHFVEAQEMTVPVSRAKGKDFLTLITEREI